MKFKDRIIRIKKLLKTQYHFFSLLSDGDIMLVLEQTKGKRFSFREKTIIGALKEAEAYVTNEIEVGVIKEE